MTLAGQFIEGLPPFILTFERNIRPVEKHFLRRSLQLSIPNALMLVISVLIFHLSQVYSWHEQYGHANAVLLYDGINGCSCRYSCLYPG